MILVDSYGDLHWFKKDMEQPPTPPNTTILFSLFLIIPSLSLSRFKQGPNFRHDLLKKLNMIAASHIEK